MDSDEDTYEENNIEINRFHMAIIYRYNTVRNGEISLDIFQNVDDFYKVRNGYICAYRITINEFLDYDFDLIENHPYDVFNPYIQIIKMENVKFRDNDNQEYYSTAILKTHYLRIIQRKWKRLYKEKIQRMKHPDNIQHRMITGKWPICCRYCLY